MPARLLEVLYQDARCLVVNKPAGVAIQGVSTSQAGLRWKQLLKEARVAAGTDEDLKSVHRLDAGTTGCLVLAKTGASAKSLFTQFKSHMVGKRYLAIVARGEQGWSSESGTIEGFIRPTEEGPQFLMSSPPEPRYPAIQAASASWTVMSTCKTHSLLEFVPKTGRKHQLRLMSAQALRAPIVGDWKYGWRGPEEMNGHLLHAADIQFYYWLKTGKRQTVRVEAPLPKQFVNFAKQAGLSLPSPAPVIPKAT